MQHLSPAQRLKHPFDERVSCTMVSIDTKVSRSSAGTIVQSTRLEAFDAIAQSRHGRGSRKERGVEPGYETDMDSDRADVRESRHASDMEAEHENEAFDSPIVYVLWLMPLGLFGFLTVAGLTMSFG